MAIEGAVRLPDDGAPPGLPVFRLGGGVRAPSGQRPSALSAVEVAGQSYPLVSASRCHVCQSVHRAYIERALVVEERSAWAVLEDLPAGHGLSARNIRDHRSNGHIAADAAVATQIREEHLNQMVQCTKEQVEIVTDRLDLARIVAREVVERLASGELVPDVKDGLAATQLLARYDNEAAFDREETALGFILYMESLQQTVAEFLPGRKREFLEHFGGLLSRNPLMRQLLAAHTTTE